MTEIVPLTPEYLDKLLEGAPDLMAAQLSRSYFSPGSSSLCLLNDGEPVFAGGIVNLQWNRGEAWIIPTHFFRSHAKLCLRSLKEYLPKMAQECGFIRVQATCIKGVSDRIFPFLGFAYEGTLKKFGPHQETCTMWSRIMEQA